MAGKLIISLALILSTIPCLLGQVNGKSTSEKDIAEPRLSPLYVIQPSDVLEIFVWKEPQLTRKVFVRPDGRISALRSARVLSGAAAAAKSRETGLSQTTAVCSGTGRR